MNLEGSQPNKTKANWRIKGTNYDVNEIYILYKYVEKIGYLVWNSIGAHGSLGKFLYILETELLWSQIFL